MRKQVGVEKIEAANQPLKELDDSVQTVSETVVVSSEKGRSEAEPAKQRRDRAVAKGKIVFKDGRPGQPF